ncbi:hypothetical protein MYX78_08355, partial [Acidobacteria bacterium AH-259-G07]|nr:hypothetical protein [Acidobacteria bacterium AH-259-G07]
MRDTPTTVEAKFREMILARSPAERLAMACQMFATGKALIGAGLVQEYGHLERRELRRHIFLRLYGQDFPET